MCRSKSVFSSGVWLLFLLTFSLSLSSTAQNYNAFISTDKVSDSIYEFRFMMDYDYTKLTSNPSKGRNMSVFVTTAINGQVQEVPIVDFTLDTQNLYTPRWGSCYLATGTARMNVNLNRYAQYDTLDSFIVAFQYRDEDQFIAPGTSINLSYNDYEQMRDSGAVIVSKVFPKNIKKINRNNRGPEVGNRRNLSLFCDAIYRSNGITDNDGDSLAFGLSELIEILFKDLKDDDGNFMLRGAHWYHLFKKDYPIELNCPPTGFCTGNSKRYFPYGISIDPITGDLVVGVGDKDATTVPSYENFPVTTSVREFGKDTAGKSLLLTESYYVSHFYAYNNQYTVLYGPSYPNQASRLINMPTKYSICAGDTLRIPIRTTEGRNHKIKTPIKNYIGWNESIDGATLTITDTSKSKKQALFEWVPKSSDVQDAAHRFTLYVETDSSFNMTQPWFGQGLHRNSYTFLIDVYEKPVITVRKDSMSCGKAYYTAEDTSNLPGFWNHSWELRSMTGDTVFQKTTGVNPVLHAPRSGKFVVFTRSTNSMVECPTLNMDTIEFMPFLRFNGLTDTSICSNDSVYIKPTLIDSSSAVSYQWTSKIRSASGSDWYILAQDSMVSLRVSDTACSYEKHIDVTTWQVPEFSLGSDTVGCYGESITLTAPATLTNGLWNNSDTSSMYNGTVPETVTYTVEDSNKCITSDTIELKPVPSPDFEIKTTGTSCRGDELTVELTDPESSISSVRWELDNDTFVGKQFTRIPDETFQFSLIIQKDTLDKVCTYTQNIVVPIFTPYQIKIDHPDTICASNLPTILNHNGTANGSVKWSDNSDTFSPLLSGLVMFDKISSKSIEYTDSNGCITRDTATIIVESLDSLANYPTSLGTVFCSPGADIQLSGKTRFNQSILWRVDGQNIGTDNIDFNPGTGRSDGDIIQLTGESLSSRKCLTQRSIQQIEIRDKPDASFNLSPKTGCDPLTVLFSTSSATNLSWRVDNVEENTSASWTKIFTNGLYQIKLIASTDHCNDSTSQNVEVLPSPQPKITPSLREVHIDLPEITFTTENSYSQYLWATSDNGNGSTNPFKHRFASIGKHTIDLEVIDQNGCRGYASDTIQVLDKIKLLIPSSFSPNSDGINDYFLPIAVNGVVSWSMKIYNRWGEKMYEGAYPEWGWDGRTNNFNALPGMYIYTIDFSDTNGEEHSLKGHIQLIR